MKSDCGLSSTHEKQGKRLSGRVAQPMEKEELRDIIRFSFLHLPLARRNVFWQPLGKVY